MIIAVLFAQLMSASFICFCILISNSVTRAKRSTIATPPSLKCPLELSLNALRTDHLQALSAIAKNICSVIYQTHQRMGNALHTTTGQQRADGDQSSHPITLSHHPTISRADLKAINANGQGQPGMALSLSKASPDSKTSLTTCMYQPHKQDVLENLRRCRLPLF